MNDGRISRKELRKQNEKIKKRRSGIKTVLIAAVTALFLYITGIYGTSLAYLGDFLSNGMTIIQIGGGWPVQEDFSGYIQSHKMGSALCVLTDDNLLAYSPTGKQVLSYSHSMSRPVISTSKNRAVLYDLNGTSLKVINSHGVLFRKETDSNIVHCDISSSNRVAVTTRSRTYNGEVTVYNYNMEPRFAWYCATGYPVYSRLSSNGNTMAVETLNTRQGILQSRIYIIDSKEGRELYNIETGSYPLDMMFLSADKLLVAYVNGLVLYDVKNQSQIRELSFDGYSLKAVEKKGSYIAVSYGGNGRANTTVALLNLDLSQKAIFNIDDNIKSLSISNSRVFCLGEKALYEYDYTGNLVNTTRINGFTKALVNYNGTSLIDSDSITKIKKTTSRN